MHRPGISTLLIGLILFAALLALAACGGDSEPQSRVFDLELKEGKLTLDPPILKVNQNDEVVLRIHSDKEVELHLHGYDLAATATPDESAELSFVASLSGRFSIALHSSHSHNGEAGAHSHDLTAPVCEATLPPGVEPPVISLTASPAEEPGKLDVAVEIDNFVLSETATNTAVPAGHWHLYLDGTMIGMYTTPEVTVSVNEAGEHQVLVTLSDIEHCDYPTRASTTVTIESGAEEDHDHAGEEEEVIVGALEVQPR